MYKNYSQTALAINKKKQLSLNIYRKTKTQLPTQMSSPPPVPAVPNVQSNKSLFKTLYETSKTPYPAILASSTYLAQSLFAEPQPIKQVQSTKLLSSSSVTKFVMANPSKINNFLFGSVMGAASFMIIDGDLENGSGLAGIWSALYLIVNRKYLAMGLKHLRVQPVFANSLALFNAVIYGRRYLFDL